MERSTVNVGAHAELIPEPGIKAGPPRLRLDFLDGLRGLAALYVLFFHIRLTSNFSDLPAWALILKPPIAYGHFAVCVFIVLSGFCLMLPIVRAPGGELRGGLPGFLRRRARRILPPYFVALGFSLLWVAAYEGSKKWTGHANTFVDEFSLGNLLSHLLLVFNWSPAWWGTTNSAFWSVASEWQIYFVFALLLLPAWRRLGTWAALGLALALGIGPHYLLPGGPAQTAVDLACAWFILLFALGMAGAVLRFAQAPGSSWVDRAPWGTLGLLLFGLVIAAALLWKPIDNPWEPALLRHYTWSTDVLAGGATLCLIMFCTSSVQVGQQVSGLAGGWPGEASARRAVLSLLESRFAMELGGFSYSLYLIHWPILAAWLYVLVHLPLPPVVRFIGMWVGGTIIPIVAAYFFSRWFEKPFLSPVQPAKVHAGPG